MFLQDTFAAVELYHEDNATFEVWWLHEGDMLIVSHCLNNYPATILHTMSLKEAKVELKRLVREGWIVGRYSEEYWNINPKIETYKAS